MQFPESWLREFCNPPLTTNELAETLTMAGLEVEALSPVAPPFSKIVVGEIGTFAGLATDASCRVLTKDKQAVKGLYAVGNDAASIMGGNYPAAGITHGPNMTFGYVTGNHIADKALA